MALNSCKHLRISPARTESGSGSKKLANSISAKSEERKKSPKNAPDTEKKTSSKDESSLATAPENHEVMNGKTRGDSVGNIPKVGLGKPNFRSSFCGEK